LSSSLQNLILDHSLFINADSYTKINDSLIPSYEIKSVQNTVFDFRDGDFIRSRIIAEDEQLKFGNGFDHNFVLNDFEEKLRKVAELSKKNIW